MFDRPEGQMPTQQQPPVSTPPPTQTQQPQQPTQMQQQTQQVTIQPQQTPITPQPTSLQPQVQVQTQQIPLSQFQPTSQPQPRPTQQATLQPIQAQPIQHLTPNFQPQISQSPNTLTTGPRTVSAGQIRQHGEYLVLVAANPRQPGMPIRYPFIPIQRHQMMASQRANILQQPNLLRGVAQQGAIGVHQTLIPAGQPIGLGLQTSLGTAPSMHHSIINSSATAPSQMTPTDALSKGISFFNSLLTKISIKSKKTTLQNLIQSLIDGKRTSEDFATALQKELNSGPQTQLVPFLDLLLPNLRQSMNTGQTKIPGIRPPNMMNQMQPSLPDDSVPSTSTGSPMIIQSTTATTPAKKKKPPLAPGQKSAWAMKKEAREAKKKERESLVAQGIVKLESPEDKKDLDRNDKFAKPKTDKPKGIKQKKQEKGLESLASALRDDDDVNDVAAMGGVNLAEESQRIMASGAELVGTQIRSCKDEPFLDTNVLSAKISRIVKEHNLSEPSKEIITLISHSTQERLKNIVERLGILAEHRSENLKFNPKYEMSHDIKGQMKFLAELDRIEKRKHEELERELLLRVAKSRSKVEDPEQQKLRQKAKDMQRAEQEEVRQREANETALLAIGPRKKLKSNVSSSVGSFSQLSNLQDTKPNIDTRGDAIRRVKRVNMRDLQVLLELDRIQLNRLIKITTQ